MKKCTSCKKIHSKDYFYKDKRTFDGLKSQCKKCHSLSSNFSRASRKYKVKSKYFTFDELYEHQFNRQKTSNKAKNVNARLLVNRAIRLGFLKRPNTCPICNESKYKVHAHHDDYDEPLDIKWMCSRCHGILHSSDKNLHAECMLCGKSFEKNTAHHKFCCEKHKDKWHREAKKKAALEA